MIIINNILDGLCPRYMVVALDSALVPRHTAYAQETIAIGISESLIGIRCP